jgi:RHS repeat-associated protein
VESVSDGHATHEVEIDPLGRVSGRALSVDGVEVASVTYDWAYGDRLTRRTDTDSVAVTSDYTHDADGELLLVSRGGLPVVAAAYDDLHNPVALGSNTLVYDASDALVSVSGETWSSDADGHVNVANGWTLEATTSGEILSATDGLSTIDYRYDGARRLIYRSDGVTETHFVYGHPNDAWLVTASFDGTVWTDYTYDPDGRQLLAMDTGGVRHHVLSDLVGTPRWIVDDTGAIVRSVDRTPWGTVLSDSHPLFGLPIGFAGGIEDPATGLVRFGRRWYSPTIGRFLSRDALLRPQLTHNLFAYANNRPGARNDPTGLWGQSLNLAIGPVAVKLESSFDPFTGEAQWCASAGGGVGVGAGASFDAYGTPDSSQDGYSQQASVSTEGGFISGSRTETLYSTNPCNPAGKVTYEFTTPFSTAKTNTLEGEPKHEARLGTASFGFGVSATVMQKVCTSIGG